MVNRINQIFRKKPRRWLKLIQIEPSLQCSLDCVMCPWSELRPKEANMSWDTFLRIVPNLTLAESVDLTGGGEPLMNPNLIKMVSAAKHAGCEVGFSTNGFRLIPPIAEQLLDEGLNWISFSIDAASADLYQDIRRGSRFSEVIDNIRFLKDLKAARQSSTPRMMMVFVMMVGQQQNYQELPAFIDLAHSLGVEQVVAKNLDVILKEGDDERRFFDHDGEPAEEILSAIAEARQRAAQLGVKLRFYSLRPQEVTICEHNPLGSVFINWQGIVSPCITLSYAENRFFNGKQVRVPCLHFGDINSEELRAIWEKSEYRGFRSHYDARLLVEQQATIDHMLGGSAEAAIELPLAPEGCRTCYYLYGV